MKNSIILGWNYIWDRKTIILAYSISCVLMLWLYIALFPSLQAQAESLNQMMKSLPESMMKALGASSMDMTRLTDLLAGKHFNNLWPIILFILALSQGGGALAAEIERGTMELLLAQPISRMQLYWARVIASTKVIAFFCIVSVLPAVPLAHAYGIKADWANYLDMCLMGFAFGFATLGLGYLLSAWFSEKAKVYFVGAAVVILMYVCTIFSVLKESLTDLKYLSFFWYMSSDNALIRADIYWTGFLVLVGFGVVALGIGAWIFQKRDIAV